MRNAKKQLNGFPRFIQKSKQYNWQKENQFLTNSMFDYNNLIAISVLKSIEEIYATLSKVSLANATDNEVPGLIALMDEFLDVYVIANVIEEQ